MSKYEAVVVFSVKNGDDVSALVEKFKALIEKSGTLESVDEWGKRRLAYLINDEAEGYYVLYNFESAPEFPAYRRYSSFARCKEIIGGIAKC